MNLPHALRFFSLLFAIILTLTTSGSAIPPNVTTDPAAAAKATDAIKGFAMPEGFTAELFAAEPLLSNPVAFCIDEQGRVYVAETDRIHKGVSDNRASMFWLDDDLAANTIEDRLAVYQKWSHRRPMNYYTDNADTVRVVLDHNGDGRADEAKLFTDPFNQPLDGIASGLMAYRGNVYFTNIPHLWLLRDNDNDHRADVRKSLATGFGVRTAFLGHDLHGLTLGPDGRIYFTIGDRGYNIPKPDGSRVRDPMDVGRGACFRCEPDGSNLEVFYWGLRNPQELAFDHFGNLFTGDNNSDAGDKARIVYLVEGGDAGWAMAYQYLEGDYSRGPWHAEKIWHVRGDDQLGRPAAYLPPLAHLSNGPSGLVHYPGAGLPDRYDNHFFLADFKGTAANSGVYSFALQPDGAGYKLEDIHKFVWNVLATDVDFGYDGQVYVSDWITGWRGEGAGRIYTFAHPQTIRDEAVSSAKRLFAEGIETLSVDELAGLLRHEDYRVRLRAHIALAEKGAVDQLAAAAKQTDHRFARLHGIWGMGIIARRDDAKDAASVIASLLDDDDVEVRANAARVLGDVKRAAAAPKLRELLGDASPRVRMLAAIALGDIGDKAAVEPLMNLLRDNDDRDLFLRHGAVMGLVGAADVPALLRHAGDSSAAVRRGIVLALRQKQDPALTRFLNDVDVTIVAEAARAIYDMNIESAMPALADAIDDSRSDSTKSGGTSGGTSGGAAELATAAFLRRAISANYRLGTSEAAERLAAFAANAAQPQAMRSEALAALGEFANPGVRDRVLNFYRPLAARDTALVRDALQHHIKQIISSGSGSLRAEATRIAAKFGVAADDDLLVQWVGDDKQDAALRIEALNSLASRKHPRATEAIDKALVSGEATLRAAARDALAQVDPKRALEEITRLLVSSSSLKPQASSLDVQRAYATLATMKSDKADVLLSRALDDLIAGKLDPAVQLDVIEAAKQRPALNAKLETFNTQLSGGDPLAAFRSALQGGDAGRGKAIFEGHIAAQCMRCHKIGDTGGEAGPDLTKVGDRSTREHLLESLINPQAQVAPGYGTVVFTLKNGTVLAGTLRSEEAGKITVVTPDNKAQTINAADVVGRTPAISAMPPMGAILTPMQVRDLVEYLANRK